MSETLNESGSPQDELSQSQLGLLLISVLIVALCGITYELIIATVSSYLLGNSVYQFSITIGLFMFAMGVGSYLTKRFQGDLVSSFVVIEILVALIGGFCSTVLFSVFPFYVYYKPVMYSLILVIGALVGLEIPILTRILSRVESLRTSIAHVLSLDYVGALIGSVAFPLLLLPSFGLFRSSFIIGLLNIGVVFFTLVMFGSKLRRRRLCQVGAIIVATLLIAGAVNSVRIREYAESRLFANTIIFQKQTPYQRIILTKSEMSGKLRLYIDGHLQFAEVDEHRYHEALVHPVMSLSGSRKNVLILGGGDGMAAREVLKYPDVERIDLVDIDPEMTTLCHTHAAIRRINQGSLRHPKMHLHHTDAFTFVDDPPVRYDRVIIDLPDPHNEVLSKLYSDTFYKKLRRCLTSDGYFVTQSSSPFFTREAFWCIAKTIEAAEMQPLSYHSTVPSFGLWGFHLAAANGKKTDAEFSFSVPMKHLNAELMTHSQSFGNDTSRLDKLPVNSLFQPKLYELYQRGQWR
ncbi:MAG: polyamine aminopropyltransferase [Planctomycetaceae bacterium]